MPHEIVFPEAVDAEGHEVVHLIIGGRDGGEDIAYASGFLGGGDCARAEVGGG